MNKKIKVIELFDIIAKRIDIPAKVEYRQKIYEFDSEVMDYVSPDDSTCLSLIVIGDDNFGGSLNREVEILEDEEEIDIQNIEELQTFSDSTVYDYNDIDRNRKVLNMLVKAVKKLDKNKVDYIQPYKED